MLWIHIGMPKTGSTALQGYLHSNAPFLEKHDIRYMATGRDRGTGRVRLICQNTMAIAMSRGWADAPAPDAFVEEYQAHAEQHCILSSEMFFGRDLSPLYDRYLAAIPTPVKFVVYIRRFDEFIEADYKQRAKNGMRTRGVEAFVKNRLTQIESDPDYMDFSIIFDRIRAQVPGAEIVPRLYLRAEMAGNDVISDFLSLMDVPVHDVVLPKGAANKSLSRVASEALGRFDGGAGFDKKARRQLGRVLQQSGDPRLFGRDDVLTQDERKRINDTLEARNAAFRAAYFPDRARLFTANIDTEKVFQRGNPSEQEDYDYTVKKLQELVKKQG
ncbi:hypothetical protein SAMN05421665_0787 [Yoonia rosea]|uniref:Sulfotransferase family protein n=1 Tax=Yoonia rosea TaxID=287098 RepID=A0A1R3WK89_9RHOB|nr:hypothetical protein [Yoonia rosea]SIT78529.1 hypothetical protein SAMN05421665_0787 [Yoonia rosea]